MVSTANLHHYSEDFNADLTRFLEFGGNLADSRQTSSGGLYASSQGGAVNYVPGRSTLAARALDLASPGAVSVGVLLGR